MSIGTLIKTGFGKNRGEGLSFSSNVKEELSRQLSMARHCQIAEIAAIISLNGRVHRFGRDRFCIKIHTENAPVARKYFTLLKKTFNIRTDVSVGQGMGTRRSRIYTVGIRSHPDALRVLQATKLVDRHGEMWESLSLAQNVVTLQNCCRRAFIRGAFLAAGSVSDPERFYHFEIACGSEAKAVQLQGLIRSFDLDARIVKRKKYYVVYIKEGSQIVDILNVMEALVSLMELENIRILKEMRGSVNRQVNCETANIHKTVSAAIRQVEAITVIRDKIGFDRLPENLQEIARLRLARPEATLKELGEALDPPVGKSGVNHRLRKLGIMAEKLQSDRPGTQA